MKKRKKTFKVEALVANQPTAKGSYYCGIDWAKPGKGYSVMWDHQAAKALMLPKRFIGPGSQTMSASMALGSGSARLAKARDALLKLWCALLPGRGNE